MAGLRGMHQSLIINRIAMHRTSPKILIGVHTEEDAFCPWKYAHDIYKSFDYGRNILALPPTTLVKLRNLRRCWSPTRPSVNHRACLCLVGLPCRLKTMPGLFHSLAKASDATGRRAPDKLCMLCRLTMSPRCRVAPLGKMTFF